MSCNVCLLNFKNKQDSICCLYCQTWYHYECGKLSWDDFIKHTKNKSLILICPPCLKNTNCGKCSIKFKTNRKANEKTIYCDLCQKYFHLKCTGLKINDFFRLGNSDEPWFCRPCHAIMFPFQSLDNSKFNKLFEINNKPSIIPPISLPYNKKCGVCSKTVNQCKLHCNTCKHYIHKKCSRLKPYEISKIDANTWECSNCLQSKFPFVLTTQEEITWMNFNSNSETNCLCHNTIPSDLNTLLNSIADDNSEFSDFETTIMPTFKYFDIHDFHKLKLHEIEQLSCIHTNIDGINNNIEDLENLLSTLNHEFDIIALTETHNPEEKNHLFTAPKLNGYRNFISTTGTTSKSGSGLYVREHLNPIPRTDLDFKHYDKTEEFESIWIEIVTENGPNIIVSSMYRHPTTSNDNFLKYLRKVFTQLKKEKQKLIVLAGDFNTNLLKYGDDSSATKFLNFMIENNFQTNITGPTKMVESCKPSLIDNIFTFNITDQISGIILDKISYDHILWPNFISFKIHNPKKRSTHIKTRDTANFDEK